MALLTHNTTDTNHHVIFTKSAPKPSAIAILSGVTNLPDAANFTFISNTIFF